MVRTFALGSTLALAASLVATTASAQDAGPAGQMAAKGHLIVSAERVMPFFAYTNEKIGGNPTTSTSNSSLSLMSFGPRDDIAYNVPRIAFDYTIIDRLTLGGSLILYFDLSRSSTESDNNGRSVSADQPKLTAWGISPRVGYMLPIGDNFAFWPRGGFSYWSVSASNPTNNLNVTNTSSFHQFGLDLEPMFVWAPVTHFGFVFGPAIDVPITGGRDNTTVSANGFTATTSVDNSQFHFGITAGLLGSFGD